MKEGLLVRCNKTSFHKSDSYNDNTAISIVSYYSIFSMIHCRLRYNLPPRFIYNSYYLSSDWDPFNGSYKSGRANCFRFGSEERYADAFDRERRADGKNAA